jgi:hypothetical protein
MVIDQKCGIENYTAAESENANTDSSKDEDSLVQDEEYFEN